MGAKEQQARALFEAAVTALQDAWDAANALERHIGREVDLETLGTYSPGEFDEFAAAVKEGCL